MVGIDLLPFVFDDPVCDLEEGVVGSDVGYLVGYLGTGIGCLGCLGSLLEDLAVVQFLL